MKRLLVIALVSMLFLTSCSPAPVQDPSDFAENEYKVAYILNGTSTDIFKMAFNAAVKEGAYYGMKVDIFTSEGDDLRFQDLVNQCAQQGYDGLFLSHGKPQYSYDLIEPLIEKGIEVVTFDTVIADAEGKGIDGVTVMFQDDQKMAQMTLDYICDELFPEVRPVRVLKLWRGPGIPPFDRRQEIYKQFEDEGKIVTLEVLGPTNPADSEGSIASVVSSILPKYPPGKADVIWSAYNAYGRGAYKALTEAGRTDIPLVSIDISNQDMNFMREEVGLWKASVAVHFENIGIMGTRLLAKKLHGDEVPAEYILAPSIVTADQLTPDANVENLGTIIEGYGVCEDHLEDWMVTLREQADA